VPKPHLWFALYAADHLLPDVQNYLPTFDQDIAKAILGGGIEKRDTSSLRLAIHLYFMAFGKQGIIQKSGLEVLQGWIRQKLPHYADKRISSLSTYNSNCWLFADDGPTRLAEKIPTPADLQRICEEHRVPTKGGFFTAVRDEVLLLRLRQAHPDAVQELVGEISKRKRELTHRGTCLGAEGIRTLIHRVRDELSLDWPDHWLDAVLTMGCHPDVPRTTADYSYFWKWATQEDLNIVSAGLARRNVEKFLSILEAYHGDSHQYKNRALFLRHLLKHRKIIRVRVLVSPSHFREMKKYPDIFDQYAICSLDREVRKSVIFIQCQDGVQIIEGSEDFALGLFVEGKPIPVKGVWDPNKTIFELDSLITIRLPGCMSLRHDHKGHWMNKVIRELRNYHVEWPELGSGRYRVP
jgi:hypothetical protein